MPLNYKPVTKIKIKRGPDLGIKAHILDDGELAWSTDLHRLYVGDSTTPGGILVNIDNTSTLAHTLASTTTLTPYHVFDSGVEKGMMLKAGLSTDPLVSEQGAPALGQGYMGYLNFYDIKFDDARHWLHDHGMQTGLSIPISTTAAFSRSNSTSHTFPVYTSGNTWSADTTSAYGVSYASAMDYTSAIQSGTDYAPVATYESSEFKIKFKSVPILIQDAFNETSIALTHDILDHTSSQVSHIVYSDASKNIQALQYDGAGDGAVLKYNTSSGLNFGKLRYRDLTGLFVVNDSTDAIFKPLQVYAVDSTTRIWAYNRLVRLAYGDPTGIAYLPQHSQFNYGRNLIHYFSKPENSIGYTPPGLYYTDPDNGTLATTPPYRSDTKLYISSWDENMYGPQNSISGSDLGKFQGSAWIHLHGIQSSLIQFETKNLGGFMGMFSPKDSTSLLTLGYGSGSTYEAFGLFLADKNDCDFMVWTRKDGTFVWNQYGSTTPRSTNKPEFVVNRYGGIKISGSVINDVTQTNALGAPYDASLDLAAAIHVQDGVSCISKHVPRGTYGIKLSFIDSEIVAPNANGINNKTIGLDISRVSSSGTNYTGGFEGTTTGIYIEEISGKNLVSGIVLNTIISQTDSNKKIYGIQINNLENSGGGGAGILLDRIDLNKFAHGILINEINSDTTAACAITIGPRTTGGSCSTYGMWITNKDIRNTGGVPDRLSSNVDYSIMVDNGGGEFYFGDGGTIAEKCIFGAGMDITGDSTSRNNFLFTSSSGAAATVKLTTGGGYLKIDADSGDINDTAIQITNAKSKVTGLWNHGGAFAIADTIDITSGGGWWVVTDSTTLNIDATSTGIITFSPATDSINQYRADVGGNIINYISPIPGTGVPTTPIAGATVYPTGYDTSGFALGQILVITGSDALIRIATADASTGMFASNPAGKYPIILDETKGSWQDMIGNSLTLMFQRARTNRTTPAEYQYFWGEISRSEVAVDYFTIMLP